MKNKKDKLFLLISGTLIGIVFLIFAIRTNDKSGIILFTIVGIGIVIVSLMQIHIYIGIEKPNYEEARKYFLGLAYKDFEK